MSAPAAGGRLSRGFLGRMTTGAVAAPVFLVLISVLIDEKSSEELTAIAGNIDTLAWAVLIGAASPVAWKAGEALVTARMGQLSSAIAAANVEEGNEALRDLAASNELGDGGAQIKLGRAIGRLDSAQRVLSSGSGRLPGRGFR